MTNIEKVKKIRDITMSPFKNINVALEKCSGDVDKTIALLISEKQADVTDMANRVANASIVYSYIHNNRVGAMIVVSCQTDFVAKNELFIQLAKDICMHIVSNPTQAEYVDEQSVNGARKGVMLEDLYRQTKGKPQPIQEKIVQGKMQKWYSENCLLNQKFIKDDTITIQELINKVSGTVGERIEIKKFVRLSA